MGFGRTSSALLVWAILACPALCSAEANCTSCLDACGETSPQPETHHPERECGEHPCFCQTLQSVDQGATRGASVSVSMTQPAACDWASAVQNARPAMAGLSAISRVLGALEPLTIVDLPLLI